MEEIANKTNNITTSQQNNLSGPLTDNLSVDSEKIKLILNKLSNLGIKKILIVDDTPENIEVAKRYFDNIPLQIDYASDSNVAIQRIKDEYKNGKYDLILTDLEMESEESGFDVAREGFAHQADTFVVTGRNYDKSHSDHHGPSTYILGLDFSIKSKKNEKGTWEAVLDSVVNHIGSNGIRLHDFLKRYHKYIGKPSYDGADVYISFLK